MAREGTNVISRGDKEKLRGVKVDLKFYNGLAPHMVHHGS
jgi:hypothetical protein